MFLATPGVSTRKYSYHLMIFNGSKPTFADGEAAPSDVPAPVSLVRIVNLAPKDDCDGVCI